MADNETGPRLPAVNRHDDCVARLHAFDRDQERLLQIIRDKQNELLGVDRSIPAETPTGLTQT
jgi:hypothetical protein